MNRKSRFAVPVMLRAVALASALNVFRGSAQFFFYAGLALLASVALAFIARRTKEVDWYQKAAA